MTSGAIQFRDTSDLRLISDDCWSSLARTPSDRDCGWRLPVLATAADVTVRQRIVVLRKVESATRTLFAHTDLRSPKVAAMRTNPSVSWLFYDHASMIQLQIEGRAQLHEVDEVANELWQAEPESSLRGYLAPLSPGLVTKSPSPNLPADVVGRIPSREELMAARDHFCVVSCVAKRLEWLWLDRSGNRRAIFEYEGESVEKMSWLAP